MIDKFINPGELAMRELGVRPGGVLRIFSGNSAFLSRCFLSTTRYQGIAEDPDPLVDPDQGPKSFAI
jgi:hypothetical protein